MKIFLLAGLLMASEITPADAQRKPKVREKEKTGPVGFRLEEETLTSE